MYSRVQFVLAILFLVLGLPAMVNGQGAPRVAVLDFGDSRFGRLAADILTANLRSQSNFLILDRDQTRAAAKGVGYEGSLNLDVNEARNLGSALGCDIMLLGDAQTQRRSPSTGPIYFDSYASIFVVSSRTGRLIRWERPGFRANSENDAEKPLISELANSKLAARLKNAIEKANDEERQARELTVGSHVPVIEEAPGDETQAEADGLRLPRPFRRFIPNYPETAAEAEAEATVDVLVDLDAAGEVGRVEITRWAGFGLDEATIETVRKLHFFPAMRNGVAVPIRVLLRYNFRKPPRS